MRHDIVSLSCLRGCLDGGHLNDFTDQTMAAALRELGWRKYDRILIEGTKHQVWVKGLVKDVYSMVRARMKFL